MNRIIVSVHLPALSKFYDAVLPHDMKVGTAASLLAALISKQENIMISNDMLVLALKDSETVLDDDKTVCEAGIRDGYTLILV